MGVPFKGLKKRDCVTGCSDCKTHGMPGPHQQIPTPALKLRGGGGGGGGEVFVKNRFVGLTFDDSNPKRLRQAPQTGIS